MGFGGAAPQKGVSVERHLCLLGWLLLHSLAHPCGSAAAGALDKTQLCACRGPTRGALRVPLSISTEPVPIGRGAVKNSVCPRQIAAVEFKTDTPEAVEQGAHCTIVKWRDSLETEGREAPVDQAGFDHSRAVPEIFAS